MSGKTYNVVKMKGLQIYNFLYRSKTYKDKIIYRFYRKTESKVLSTHYDISVTRQSSRVDDISPYMAVVCAICRDINIEQHKFDRSNSRVFALLDQDNSNNKYVIIDNLCDRQWYKSIWKKADDEGAEVLFCAEPTIIDGDKIEFGFITTNHEAINSYLNTHPIIAQTKTLHSSPNTSTKIRMANWYGKELAHILREEAQACIDNFVYQTKFELDIVDFIVAPELWIAKYLQVIDLFDTLYKPKYIMPLSMTYDNTNYIIHIPIQEDATTITKHSNYVDRSYTRSK